MQNKSLRAAGAQHCQRKLCNILSKKVKLIILTYMYIPSRSPMSVTEKVKKKKLKKKIIITIV